MNKLYEKSKSMDHTKYICSVIKILIRKIRKKDSRSCLMQKKTVHFAVGGFWPSYRTVIVSDHCIPALSCGRGTVVAAAKFPAVQNRKHLPCPRSDTSPGSLPRSPYRSLPDGSVLHGNIPHTGASVSPVSLESFLSLC